MSALTLGFIPLTDCAPLVVARDLGYFAREGLEVSLSREASWATIRDKVAVGALDGAHMLAPMVLASTLGLGGEPQSMIAPLALNQNGSAITLSRDLAEGWGLGQDAGPLARLIAARRATGVRRLTFAVVFPYSVHNYLLRYWMAQAGIDPDRDVQIVVTPPPRMVEQLAAGAIDGFCVGAPWSEVAQEAGIGTVVAEAGDIWPNGSDKVLGVREDWAMAHPETLQGLLRALMGAAAWADDVANRERLIEILARPDGVGAAPSALAKGLGDRLVFQKNGASLPSHDHAAWFLSQMIRWGQVAGDADLSKATAAFRPDLHQQATLAMGGPEATASLRQGD